MKEKACKGIHHVELVVSNLVRSKEFYNKLFRYLGFEYFHDDEDPGWTSSTSGVWIHQVDKNYAEVKYHRKRVGIGHLAFLAASRENVDKLYTEFLLPNNIPVLYGGPKDYPEYREGYYAVFFEDPDRIKLELMWFPE